MSNQLRVILFFFSELVNLPNVFLNQVSIFCSEILDQFGVVLDQECVVVAVEVDILKQLLLAHLWGLLFQSFPISSLPCALAISRVLHIA